MAIVGTLSQSLRMCLRGFTPRCSNSNLLGASTLPGAQAQYIRIPNAGGSLIPAISFPSLSPLIASHVGRGQTPQGSAYFTLG